MCSHYIKPYINIHNILGFKTEKIIPDQWCNHNQFKTFKINNIKGSNNNFKQEKWTKAKDIQETTEVIIEEEEEVEAIRAAEEEEVNIEISKTITIKISNRDQ